MVVILSILIGVIPLAGYWILLGNIPTLVPDQALRMLNQPATALLVDVRSTNSYIETYHIDGAFNWPYEEMSQLTSSDQVPVEYKKQAILLICEEGWTSALASRKLLSLGLTNVYNIRGGLLEWAKAGGEHPELMFSHFVSANRSPYLATQKMSFQEQNAQAVSGLLIKPTYMLISLILGVFLLRQKSNDLKILGWGLLLFFIGEAFCALNFWVLKDESYFSEYMHSYGMVLGFGFTAFALVEGLDQRVIHLSVTGKKCAAAPLCGVCAKFQPPERNSGLTCRLKRMYQLIIPILALLSTIPLSVRFSTIAYNSRVYSFPFFYTRFFVYQLYENRFLPILAILLFGAAYIPLFFKTGEPIPLLTHIFLSAGLGTLGFSIFRVVFSMLYQTNQVWFNFWEETTELIFVAATGVVLWLFRRSLFRLSPPPSPPAPAGA